MNYFAHGRRFIDDPYVLAGTAVPDWLNVVDRKTRVRARHAEPFMESDDPRQAALARGIVQHHRDDAWFHETRAFAELSLELCVLVREHLPADGSFRPHFLGHILLEILLDAALIADEPGRLADYYAALARLDTACVTQAIGRMANRPVENLGTFIELFCQERFLVDYADDDRLRHRLNQVMRRVGLPLLPSEILPALAIARAKVTARRDELLAA